MLCLTVPRDNFINATALRVLFRRQAGAIGVGGVGHERELPDVSKEAMKFSTWQRMFGLTPNFSRRLLQPKESN